MDPANPDEVEKFVYVLPLEKFVYRIGNDWNLAEPVSKDGIRNYLKQIGWHQETIDSALKNRNYLKVFGWDLAPNKEDIFPRRPGEFYINTWVRPSLVPAPGSYPRIQRILEWIMKGDAAGIHWFKMWLALKVQNPDIVPKVAVIMSTAQGAGKGTIGYIIRSILGFKNTEIITREALENRFNSRWLGRLFVIADEVIGAESLKDVSNLLKVLIDGNELELEGKGRDQKTIKSRLAWLFLSNDRVAPLLLDAQDRRYTVFVNHTPLPADYVEMLNGMFKKDRAEPTPEFLAEIAAFAHELLAMEIDRALVARPFDNESRSALIEANTPAHELFFAQVQSEGIDPLLDELLVKADWSVSKSRPEWDFGVNGVGTSVVYDCYVAFTKRMGARPMKANKLGAALKHHQPPWESVRVTAPSGRRVYAYVVPRTPDKSDTSFKPQPATA